MRPALLIGSCGGPNVVSTWRAHWPTCISSNASTVANRFGSGTEAGLLSVGFSPRGWMEHLWTTRFPWRRRQTGSEPCRGAARSRKASNE